MRTSVQFPDCWNGKDLDSSDHISHMAYSSGRVCPSSHSTPICTIVTEHGYLSSPYDPKSLMLSNGDMAGYSLHGDFMMGWTDRNLLQRALEESTCLGRENNFQDGSPQCNALAPTHNPSAAATCRLQSKVPEESVGLTSAITKLPGCNLLTVAGVTSCPADQLNSVTTNLVNPIFTSYGPIGPNIATSP